MLERTKRFFVTTVVGGIIVVLPATILLLAFKWLFGFVTRTIEPLTDLLLRKLPLPGVVADLIVILVIVLACFFVGLFVRTRLGTMLYNRFEGRLLRRAPGYRIIKETINQFVGKKKSPFSSVALVQLFENGTLATAFITDTHDDGRVTVFVPTGPNPTSGFIYHVDQRFVHPVDVPVEDAMRSVISCGAGSGSLISALDKKAQP